MLEGLIVVACCAGVGYFAKTRGRSPWGWGIATLFITPLISLPILLFMKNLNRTQGGNAPTPVVPPVQPQEPTPRPEPVEEVKTAAPVKLEPKDEDMDSIFETLEREHSKPAVPPVVEEPAEPQPEEASKEAPVEPETRPAEEPVEVVEKAPEASEPEPQAPVVEEPIVAAPTAAFCTNCGSKLEDGAKFCTNCGSPVAK